jgi:hypothetical protein
MKNDKINPNAVKTRDPLMVKLINGATKAGIKPDRKKKLNKAKCRGKVDRNGDY